MSIIKQLDFQVEPVIRPKTKDIESKTFSHSLSLETSPSLSETFPALLETSPTSLKTLPKEMVLCILEKLNMKSRVLMGMTCKYLKSIYESIKKQIINIENITLNDKDVHWKLLRDFEHAFEYIFQYLSESSPECSKKALLWVQNYESNDELKLLREFVFQYPQTPILFWKGDTISFVNMTPAGQFSKLKSLKYLCISGGCLSVDWPIFFHGFKQLKLIYFRQNKVYCSESIWAMNIQEETLFIMDLVEIEKIFGNIE
jgi:hypothetical protein